MRKVDLELVWIDRANAGQPLASGEYYEEEDIAREILREIRSEGLGSSKLRK